MQLIFATNNRHKVEEIQSVLPSGLSLLTLKEAGIDIDIPEPHPTLEENAAEKGSVIHALTGKNCFSEDSGLEVAALNGEPGVRSARYAGEEADPQKNIALLLRRLEGVQLREARFRTVIYLRLEQQEYYFDGVCTGKILDAPRGAGGFGYDPVFVPDGSDKTFAEMSLDEKNRYSHRRKAVDKLVEFLNTYPNNNQP